MQKGFYVIRGSGAAQLSPPFPRGGQGVALNADVFDVPGGGVALQIGESNFLSVTPGVLG